MDGYEKEKYRAYDGIEKFLNSPNRSCPGSFSVYEKIFFWREKPRSSKDPK